MLFSNSVAIAALVPSVMASALRPVHPQQADLSRVSQSESPIALQSVLRNIGANGSDVAEASAGVVVASPSTSNPDYFYTWTRDAAVTFSMIVERFLAGDNSLDPLIHQYIVAQAKPQTIPNPSGDLSHGTGLGEPKFYANITAFLGSWGRSQWDGPALRASTLTAYSKHLMAAGQQSVVQSNIWPVVHDLSYVAEYWNQAGFDLRKAAGTTIATGRYAEDTYQGGNPCYTTLCTNGKDKGHFLSQRQAFHSFKTLSRLLPPETTPALPPPVTKAVQAYADGFVSVVQQYIPNNGTLSEQFSRDNGTPTSARDLTWSYASFLTAVARRGGSVPSSWGLSRANKVPTLCQRGTATGTYVTPTVTSW
ncbi:glycosyl hydrolase family 15 [Penicillium lagena]|uniref:glycosyl hydrolase family 15 n=1 Tax=Penicillium lagena TaxID=94218 RepID=UPI00253FE2AC|nr:glycosyl hydrolase family 15 [Penicillium lagena]KAJ5609979.1 glycosyl hydrolase family 15 [Penicillium lagena]